MDIHVCKQCGTRFVYCRACVFRPIRYKDAGFCSKECYEASKKVVEPTVEEIAIIEVNKPLIEEIKVETIVPTEVSIEATIVEESIVKKETNTYKKKKNKYEVHE